MRAALFASLNASVVHLLCVFTNQRGPKEKKSVLFSSSGDEDDE